MTTKEYMKLSDDYTLHTYNRFPIVLERGEGVRLYDTDGREYLDFAAGIAVHALGYHSCDDVLKAQIDKLMHSSNLFYNTQEPEAAFKLVKATGLSKAFFTNSGTEAVEGAIKAAKKYAYSKDGTANHEIIAMENSFHGRSLGSLSVTANEAYQAPFRPLIEGVRFAKFNDIDSVKSMINDKTCAIIMETVQGEGGIYPVEEGFLKEVRDICDKRDIVLILDEVQCGMGRCGDMFAYQGYGVLPDIVTCAKALGCGVPVGAFVVNDKLADSSLLPGDHGTTYGGNPLVCAIVKEVFEIFEKQCIIEHVRTTAPYLEKRLDEIVQRSAAVSKRRGKGFMQGLVIEGRPVGDVVKDCLDNGLVVISAGHNVLRLVPPLIITETDIDEMIKKLEMSI